MKLRNRTIPLPLQKLDAAIPRLSPCHSSFPGMKKDAAKRQRGYTGEMKVDYHLDNLSRMYTILQDVYLLVFGKNFQIDSLIIGNHSIFINETKNCIGTITFNTLLKQLIRDDGTIESGLEYPITQVENQQFHLQSWLVRNKLAGTPINCLVAIAEPSTIVKVEGSKEEIAKVVAHGAGIPKMIMGMDQELGRQGAKKLQDYQIGKLILRACREFDLDVMKEYGLRRSDILPGVICPDCRMRGMKRVHSGWKCSKCGCHSRNAHLKTISDYLLLISNTITNNECSRFLGLKSRNTATRILKNSGLAYYEKGRCWGTQKHYI